MSQLSWRPTESCAVTASGLCGGIQVTVRQHVPLVSRIPRWTLLARRHQHLDAYTQYGPELPTSPIPWLRVGVMLRHSNVSPVGSCSQRVCDPRSRGFLSPHITCPPAALGPESELGPGRASVGWPSRAGRCQGCVGLWSRLLGGSLSPGTSWFSRCCWYGSSHMSTPHKAIWRWKGSWKSSSIHRSHPNVQVPRMTHAFHPRKGVESFPLLVLERKSMAGFYWCVREQSFIHLVLPRKVVTGSSDVERTFDWNPSPRFTRKFVLK